MTGTEKWYGNHPVWVLHASELQKVKESGWKSGTTDQGEAVLANAIERVASTWLTMGNLNIWGRKQEDSHGSFLWLLSAAAHTELRILRILSEETLAEPNRTGLSKFTESKHRRPNIKMHGNQQQWRPHWRCFQGLLTNIQTELQWQAPRLWTRTAPPQYFY